MSQNQPISYNDAVKNRRDASNLPMDRYFTVKEWESLMQKRDLLFTQLGQFRTATREQFREIAGALKAEVEALGDEKYGVLFGGIMKVMSGLSETAHLGALAARKTFGFYATASKTPVKAVEFDKDTIVAPPGRRGSI